jgi:hypothetical protein
MIAFLRGYFSLGLALALVAPLWLAVHGSGSSFHERMRDAVIWSGVILGLWILITQRRGFHVKGTWRRPELRETELYVRLLLAVLLIDFGSKAFFFRWEHSQKIELIANFGLHSVFHETAFEPFHLVLLLYFLYLFVLGGLFFRFDHFLLDRAWLMSCAFALGGSLALFGERYLFGGVHNSFYFAGPLMWICPPCASPHFSSYAWTPADLFVHAAFLPLAVLVLSYFVGTRDRSLADS